MITRDNQASLYNRELISFREQAGCWFLHSGIQEPSGGVARYHRSDIGRNAGVSTEITGYSVSSLVYLYSLERKAEYLDTALRAAGYLARQAWDPAANTFPFEPGSPYAYFFDIGIIVRGLLAAWRATGREEFQIRAREAALSLAFDFMGDGVFHPVISLPEKQPLAYEPRWAHSPGCYQLKSALVWRELGDPHASRLFEAMLAYALATHESYLPGDSDRHTVMDRLHPYCYFLEGLLAVANREEVRRALVRGIKRTGELLRDISPEFERSDVCAQLLRVRLIAHHLGVAPLDESAACEEADRAASYQSESINPHLRGGFWFGKKSGKIMPFMNPVSTAFCMQALELWHQHQAGKWCFELRQLI